jgi:hypothetical protein
LALACGVDAEQPTAQKDELPADVMATAEDNSAKESAALKSDAESVSDTASGDVGESAEDGAEAEENNPAPDTAANVDALQDDGATDSLAAKQSQDNNDDGLGDGEAPATADVGEDAEEPCVGEKCKQIKGEDLIAAEAARKKRAKQELGEAVEAQKAAENDEIPAEVGPIGKGEAYIPLSPTIPRLTVMDHLKSKGLFEIISDDMRPFAVNGYADMSSTVAGAAVFGGNMHVLTAKDKAEFRYSNTHGQIGGIGFAANYPHYNKASVISSNTKAATKDGAFTPKVIQTFTGDGNVGIGVDGPASKLHVQGDGNSRLINVNHWGDVSGCSSGVASFSGNAYVTTEQNKANFRYANAHSAMGAIGFATNYPDWNKATIYTSGTTASEAKKVFKPKEIATFTHEGRMGLGTTTPAAALDIQSAGRQLAVSTWLDVSSQGSAGFVGLNAHLIEQGGKRMFAFSNTAADTGSIGLATNYPLANQMSVVASKETSSNAGTTFTPETIATFTQKGMMGVGTDAPAARLDVRHASDRQISANKFADMSANEQLQGFFGGNGYAVGQGFNFANDNAVAGAIGLATHYPKPGEASIISSGTEQPKEGSSFKPVILAKFDATGSMEITKDVEVHGDLRVYGRVINGDDNSQEYDFMAAHEALVTENTMMRERLSRMEAMMSELMSSK